MNMVTQGDLDRGPWRIIYAPFTLLSMTEEAFYTQAHENSEHTSIPHASCQALAIPQPGVNIQKNSLFIGLRAREANHLCHGGWLQSNVWGLPRSWTPRAHSSGKYTGLDAHGLFVPCAFTLGIGAWLDMDQSGFYLSGKHKVDLFFWVRTIL